MSVKKDIYLAITSYLMETLNGENGVRRLEWVDKDFGQLDKLDQVDAFPRPAILMSFGTVDWELSGGSQQQGDAVLEFKVIFDNFADSFDGSDNQQLALEFFDFNEAVFEALQGLYGDGFTSLTRIQDEEDTDHDNFIVTPLRFATVITDTNPVLGKQKQVEPPVNIIHKKALTEKSVKAVSDFITPT